MAFEPWRYPGIFNLNQSASLPNSFGPPNMSQQFQSGISALADPLVARMKEEQARSELAKKAADTLAAFGTQYTPTAATPGTASTGTTAAPMRTSSTAGSPADDDTGGVQGGGAQGTSTALLDASRRAIGTVESGGNYSAVGPATKSGDRAYGMFQVMGNNVGPWTEKHFGQRLSPQEFLKNPDAQEAVFRGEFGGYLDRYGNIRDAASKWFSGRPYAEAARSGASDGYNTVDQYVAKVARNLDRRIPTPPPAPMASFAPQVAPAPTPQAAASVTAPAAPQQAPQQPQPKFTAPNLTQADYQKEIYRALNAGDKQKASELAAERDMVAAQQAQQEPQQQAGPQPAPGPQSQAPTPQQQQQAQQAQVIGNVAQTAQENDQRLDAERQAGQRTRVASISPDLPGLGLGGVMPGAAQPGPPAPPPRPALQPPAMGEPSFFSPEPMVPPQFAARPATPAPPSAASAPAAPAGPTGPPPQQPAGVPSQPQPAPYQVAQAQGLPPVVSVPQQQQVRPISREQARVLLNNATTPEELNRVAAMLYQNQQQVQQQAAPTPNRFDLKHDGQGNWFREDKLTGEVTPLRAAGGGGFREMSPAERQKFGVPENTGAFIGPDGKPHVLPGTSSTKITVTPEAKGEEKYNEEQAKAVRKRFDNIVEEGDKAARAKLDLNSLSEVFARTGPQGTAASFKTTVGPYLEAAGINVTGLSDAQVVQSVIERMAPQQRVVGSGQQSDAEYKGFLRSLPTLMQSPEARQQVLSMLQSQNDIAVRKAQIIADHDEGNIDRKTAMQQIRALPSHDAVFQQFKQQNKDLYTQGQRDAGARKDSGNPEDLRKAQQGGPGATKANPVPVASDTAALRLKPGTWFRLPNGRTGIVEE